MIQISKIPFQLLTTIWAIVVAFITFGAMNIMAIIAMPFPKQLREKIFYLPSPLLMKTLFHIGCLAEIEKIDHRTPETIKQQKNRSTLYIANHCSMVDPPFLNSAYPISTLMKFEVLYIPFLTLPSLACGAITVKRGDRNSRKSALLQSIARLTSGSSVFYFPEGTRAKKKPIKEFDQIHLPLLKAAYINDVAVLPITIKGTRELLSPLNLVNPLHKMTMVSHNYVYPCDFQNEMDFCQHCWAKVVAGLNEGS